MSTILSITLPIYLLIGLGFLTVRSGYVAGDHVKALSAFVVRVALPALIFLAVGTADPAEVLHRGLFLAYLGGSGALFLTSVVVGRFVLRQRWSLVGLAALGVTGSNSAFVGFPLLSILFPEQAVTTFAVAMLVENALLIPLALAIAGAGERTEGTALTGLLNGLKGLAGNPIFLSLLAALAWSQLGVTLPDPLMRPIEMLRPVAGPVALFAVGGTVAGATSFRGIARPAILIALGKLVLHPLAFFGAAMMVPDLPADLRLAGLINAACPMMALFSIFGITFGRGVMTSATLLVTTMASFATISALLWLLG